MILYITTLHQFIISFFILLAAHAFGDFAFQSNYLAKYKAESKYLLFIHCIVYTTMCLCGYYLIGILLHAYLHIKMCIFIYFGLIILISHFIIDYLKCAYRAYLESRYDDFKKADKYAFKLDQFIHLLILVIAVYLL